MGTSVFETGALTTGAGTADNVSLTTLNFMAIQGGTATQASFVEEVYMGGQATASAPTIMLLGRDSTVGVGMVALTSPNSFGLTNPSGAVVTAIPVAFITASGTQPIRSNTVTLAKKNFTFNSFGGIVKASYQNTQDRFGIIGSTASLGEMSLSAFTGTTTSSIGAHIIIEVMTWILVAAGVLSSLAQLAGNSVV